MPTTVIDLRAYAGRWIAQRSDGEIVADAATYRELMALLKDKDIEIHRVAITEIPKEDGLLLL